MQKLFLNERISLLLKNITIQDRKAVIVGTKQVFLTIKIPKYDELLNFVVKTILKNF